MACFNSSPLGNESLFWLLPDTTAGAFPADDDDDEDEGLLVASGIISARCWELLSPDHTNLEFN